MTELTQEKKYIDYLIGPLFLLAISILYSIWILNVMNPSSNVDMDRVIQKVITMILLCILVIVSQRFREYRIAYFLMFIGLTIVLFGEIENVLDEFVVINYNLSGWDLEDFSALGLLLVGLGIFLYTNRLDKIRLKTEQNQRETELYATLLRHDLRNDLQAVLGYIEMAESDETRSKTLIESARMAATRMSRLVKTFSLQSESSDKELLSMIDETAIAAEKTHPGLTISINADQNIMKARVYGTSLIQVALENLFRNASQYCGEYPHVDVNLRRISNQIEMIISDNGPGIPSNLIDRIFLRGSSNEGGIGLYLVSTILKGCGSTIELLDAESGANFRILLPATF
ncbi:MAG: Spo0B domain-containing protein [Candidatus Thorarchaeota archaeon]|nr:Spo0B domain-containing protein [Candidatus Thorarchaeota archaeon]